MVEDRQTDVPSPKWESTTKLVVGLTFVAIVGALLVRFRTIIGPLILAFILTYLLHPLAARFRKATNLSWRMSVNLIYLVLVVILGVLFTIAGLAVAQQLESLVGVVERFVTSLPDQVENFSNQIFSLGPFTIDLSRYFDPTNIESVIQELLSAVQPLLGRAGGLVSTLATGTAATLGWGLFVIVVSYFLLADAGQVPDRLVSIELPGYSADIRRLGRKLGSIWNAFLRGQLVIFVLLVVLYTLMMTILGVRYAIGIAILAGFSRFVPYIGPLTVVIVIALVSFFQKSNYFGLEPWQYMLLVVGVSFVVDQIFDNLVTPRFLGQALGVHPAGVLVSAIVAANLLGLVGLVLAAPALATLNLLGQYTIRKMFDLDPWPDLEEDQQAVEFPWTRWRKLVFRFWRWFYNQSRDLWRNLRERFS
ncbi:MAG: AI-2E family transporter [Anaerolineales bacterium]|jgi:predicted PurR-regulated permease PerM